MAINIYDVDKEYIRYIQGEEREKRGFTRVPNMDYGDREQKFICGAVFRQNGLNYYVPVSSNKTSRKSTVLIEFKEDKFNKIKGSLNFAYMFPVPDCAIQRKNIFDEVDASKRIFLFRELSFLRSHRNEIQAKAKNVYFTVSQKESEKFKYICCDFKFLETKAKLWEKEQMKNKNREVYYFKENGGIVGLNNILNYEQSVQWLKMGVPLVMEAFTDKEGKLYTRYDLEDMFKNVSFDEEIKIMQEKGIKDCYVEVQDVADYQSLRYKFYSNCIINPSVMDLNTSTKFNTTVKALTDPSYCFNKEKCSQIELELIAVKPLTTEKLASISEKYIDDKAKETLKISCDKNSYEPNAYDVLSREIDWSPFKHEQENSKARDKEIIWGRALAGAEDYAKDLVVAQETSRDIDGADIPNNTPEERTSVKNEVKKAMDIKEGVKTEKKVQRIEKKDIEK